MTDTPMPSPEVRAIIKSWVTLQREKYGPDWKKILSAEMAEKTMKDLGPLLDAWKHHSK